MKTNETGRSMVEMLGVLAIIGVLSIGGIAGYVSAMNRYRANEVLDTASKYATIVYTSCQTKKTMSGTACATDGTDAVSFDNSGVNAVADVTIGLTAVGENSVTLSVVCDDAKAEVCKAAASAVGRPYNSTTDGVAKGFTYTYTMS